MTWPTAAISTANLDAATDSPASARADLLAAVQAINQMIAHGGVIPGEIKAYGGTTVPGGYLACDGAAVSRTTYADLFAAIGTTWGAGNGTTTFNVPDLRERVPVGVGSAAGRMAVTRTCSITSGSVTIVVSAGNLVGVGRGMLVQGAGIPAGTTVVGVLNTTGTVTLSAGATATNASASLTFTPLDTGTVGAAGGRSSVNQSEAELAPHTHPLASVGSRNTAAGGSDTVAMNTTVGAYTTQSAGVGAALHTVQPSAVVTYIIKT